MTRAAQPGSLAADSLPDLVPPLAWRREEECLWIQSSLPGATAVFSTRLGGLSEGPYRSLNLGILTDDDRERVIGNRALLARAVGRDADSIAMGFQVHGADIEVRARPLGGLREADGQASGSPAVTPLVLVADCVPLVLAAPGAVAAVHCGWRGVGAGVVEHAAATLRELSGDREISAAIGPGIGPCCYEVGDEVRAVFAERGHARDVMAAGRLDIALAVRRELERLDVGDERVAACGLCTSCHPELFFSHRRDGGRTGRQAGLAWLD